MAEYLGDVEPFLVYPENWEIASWFLMLETRWVISPSGRYVCLNDQAVLAQMEMRGVRKKDRVRLLDGLMVMERAALKALYEEQPAT